MALAVTFFNKMPIIVLMFINGKEFLTVADMAERSGKTKDAVKKILFRHEIEPVAKDAIYPVEVFKIVESTPGKGRPKKTQTPEKPAIKGKKA